MSTQTCKRCLIEKNKFEFNGSKCKICYNELERERYRNKIEAIKKEIEDNNLTTIMCKKCNTEKDINNFLSNYISCKDCVSSCNKRARENKKSIPYVHPESKTCAMCNEEKEGSFFHKNAVYCKDCTKILAKKGYEKYKEIRKKDANEYRKIRRENNIIQHIESKVCAICNIEKDESCYSYCGGGFLNSRCKECRMAEERERRKYKRENGIKTNRKPVEYLTSEYFLNKCRHRLYALFKAYKQKKNGHSMDIIGMDNPELFVKWMNFNCSLDSLEDYKEKNNWHLDHIIPCDSFDFTDIEQQKQCFHWTNMIPLNKTLNVVKQNKIILSQIELAKNRLEEFIKQNKLDITKEMYYWNNIYTKIIDNTDTKMIRNEYYK